MISCDCFASIIRMKSGDHCLKFRLFLWTRKRLFNLQFVSIYYGFQTVGENSKIVLEYKVSKLISDLITKQNNTSFYKRQINFFFWRMFWGNAKTWIWLCLVLLRTNFRYLRNKLDSVSEDITWNVLLVHSWCIYFYDYIYASGKHVLIANVDVLC